MKGKRRRPLYVPKSANPRFADRNLRRIDLRHPAPRSVVLFSAPVNHIVALGQALDEADRG